MRHVFYILIFLTTVSCKTTNKIFVGGDWTGYDYSYFCPHYSFGENGKVSDRIDILNTNHMSLAPTDYQKALNKAKDYINERGGTDFLNAITFNHIDITFKDSVENFKNKRPLYNLEKCGQTKYYIRFHYNPNKETEYRFGVALTNDLVIISKPQFPDIKTSPDFSRVISPRKALSIAKKKHKSLISPIKRIELTYDEQLNYFIWEIKSEGKTKDNPNEYEIGFVRINASNGKIIENGIKKGRILINPSF